MERLFWVKYYDKKGVMKVREDYPGLQLENADTVNSEVYRRKVYWEELYKIPLMADPYHKQVPNNINIKDVIHECAEHGSVKDSDVLGKSREAHVVRVRYFITQICLDLGFTHGELRPYFKNGVTYHYEEKLSHLREAERRVDELYLKAKDAVIFKLVGEHKDDGSGEKLKA